MAGAIWSAAPRLMLDYPAKSFIGFFQNHGLLKLTNRPQWRTVEGGSRQYVRKLVTDGRFESLLNLPVTAVCRNAQGCAITVAGGSRQTFDHVVIATHADQALAVLSDATEVEYGDLMSHVTGISKPDLAHDYYFDDDDKASNATANSNRTGRIMKADFNKQRSFLPSSSNGFNVLSFGSALVIPIASISSSNNAFNSPIVVFDSGSSGSTNTDIFSTFPNIQLPGVTANLFYALSILLLVAYAVAIAVGGVAAATITNRVSGRILFCHLKKINLDPIL